MRGPRLHFRPGPRVRPRGSLALTNFRPFTTSSFPYNLQPFHIRKREDMHERSKGGNARNFPVDYLTAINQNHLGQNLDSPSKYGGIYFFSRYARLHTFANSR
jgi:hypothetical protein